MSPNVEHQRSAISPGYLSSSPTLVKKSSIERSTEVSRVSTQRLHNYSSSITSNPSQSLSSTRQLSGEPAPFQSLGHLNPINSGIQDDWFPLYNTEEASSHHESSIDDFLTTACSSEHPFSEHTTPQEDIWERQFMTQEGSQPEVLDPFSDKFYGHNQAFAGSSELDSYFDIEPTLPKQVSDSNLAGQMPTTLKPIGVQKPTQILTVDTAPNGHGPLSQAYPRHPNTSGKPTSGPTVTVSSYDPNGDEYAGHDPQHTSKRNRENDFLDEDDSEETLQSRYALGDLSPTHLMPPDASDAATVRSVTINSQRNGVDPSQRNDDIVSSFKELELQRERQEKIAEVATWLSSNDATAESEDQSFSSINRQRSRSRGGSVRTKSTSKGERHLIGVKTYPDIPGPGVLVDVDSDDEYFENASVTSSDLENLTKEAVEDYHESDPAALSPHALPTVGSPEESSFPSFNDEVPPELEEPLPRQFYRRPPWQDSVRAGISSERTQPGSSNAAAYKFNQEAVKWETASRAATWGTRRRLSESEINAVVDGSKVRHPSLSKRGRDRTNSILSKARGLLPRRSNSNIKAEASNEDSTTTFGHSHKSSVGTIKSGPRKSSFSKPLSPPLTTGNTFLAKTGPLQSLRKHRSKSDVSNKKSPTPGLAELMTIHGGPPVPTLASPMHERESILAAQIVDNEDAQLDDDDDDQLDETAFRMDLEIRADEIQPTLEGFKDHARKLNPRLEPFLVERIAQEQLRRYKYLIDAKVKHSQAVQVAKKCSSGKYCFDLGGEAIQLTPRLSAKDPETTLTQFQVNPSVAANGNDPGFTEGIVTPAQFPTGIPLPPVKRLPAEFECQLCFKVKKGGFQKPSDWTKHVHEDIQPFSCTFPQCTETKSFKRKADWVRHENERHRHLEWWQCNFPGCSHKCFRKDNFVQHLVREHKMREPKVKGRGSSSSKNKPVQNLAEAEDLEIWNMIDSCRSGNSKQARDEPCRFCGNVCATFKKLSVHMGKHMEQIAMPILELVKMAQVGPDTIISPIEQVQTFSAPQMGITTAISNEFSGLSPYPTSASAYQTSSAGHSPTSMQGRIQTGAYGYEQGYYSSHVMDSGLQPQMDFTSYAAGQPYHGNSTYRNVTDFIPSPARSLHDHSLSPQHQLVTPRSQPAAHTYQSTLFGPTPGYSHEQLPGMYASSSPVTYVQYPPSVMQNSQSSMGMDGQLGLGLQPMNHPQSHQLFQGGGDADGRQQMQFS